VVAAIAAVSANARTTFFFFMSIPLSLRYLSVSKKQPLPFLAASIY
jgi:hypothetical protein